MSTHLCSSCLEEGRSVCPNPNCAYWDKEKPLVWSRDPPREEGWYWIWSGYREVELARVYSYPWRRGESELWCGVTDSWEASVEEMIVDGVWWWLPARVPDPPKGEEGGCTSRAEALPSDVLTETEKKKI
jgi:hypothetical protein